MTQTIEESTPVKMDYRLDYSPDCLHCMHYDYESDSCFWETDDEPLPTYPSCNKFSQRQDIYCQGCGKPFDELKDETFSESDGYEEYWGAMVARPEIIVGFRCDVCRNYNDIE